MIRIVSKIHLLSVGDVFIHTGCKCLVIRFDSDHIFCCLLSNPALKRKLNRNSEAKAVILKEAPPPEMLFQQAALGIDLNEYFVMLSDSTNPEPHNCTHFGCGRTLSIREQLFGSKCINHSKP